MLSKIKTYGIILLSMALVSMYLLLVYQTNEKNRINDNYQSYVQEHSTNTLELSLTRKELKEYLEKNREELLDSFKKLNIKPKQIERIITNTISYRDTTGTEINLDSILNSIKQNKPVTLPFNEGNECMKISGFVSYKNDSLSLKITEKTYNDTIDIVRHWKRKKILFFRIGKKEYKDTILNKCGEIHTSIIERKE